jgi:hypothetical protein
LPQRRLWGCAPVLPASQWRLSFTPYAWIAGMIALGGSLPMKLFVVWTMMFGYPVQTYGDEEFHSKLGCEMFINSLGQVKKSFQLFCAEKDQ